MLARARERRHPPFGGGASISRWPVTANRMQPLRQTAERSMAGPSFTKDITQRDPVIPQRVRHELDTLGDPI